ncbi:hypothetical protein ES707_21235 [subsurface metagenome]
MGKIKSNLESFSGYIRAIEKKLAQGDATEHTHRAALQAFIESSAVGVSATNEPKHIDCGAPDFVVRKGVTTIGYIEAKDIGISLDNTEKSDQLKRYLNSLTNLILTDYLEFRWYVDGEKRLSACLGTPTKDGKIRRDKEGINAIAKLLTTFLDHQAERVGTPQELAQRMARLAHMIRDLIIESFKQEAETGGLHNQLAAFRDNLIPDLSVEQFADMYAQTIAYGLFAARCNAPDNKDFTRQNAAYLLPKTNPFLRKLFNTIAGPDLDDRIAWLVDDLVQILAQADMAAVLKNFGRHSGKEDPVVHFYETFLKAYDSKVREMRGVYYTPEPVVSYIVRSIDGLLKDCFNKSQGLADPDVYILDPATGTATFLYMVINEIRKAFAGQKGMWNDYVAEKLLKRIFGFELLMAPYAVAHLKLGLLLQETGYKFQSDERLGIYLTNTLDEAIKHSETLFACWISEEANAAARVKKDEPIMVVLGNPPYSGHSANKGEWARQLVEQYKTVDGKPLGEKNPKWLQDDYADLWGLHGDWPSPQPGTKYFTLSETDISTTEWDKLEPHSPFYLFVPRDEAQLDEYENGWKVIDIFPVNNIGMQTHRDYFVTDIDRKTLHTRISAFRNTTISDEEVRTQFNLGEWDITTARKKVRDDKNWEDRFISCLWRPFDFRYLYYHKGLIDRPRSQITEPLLQHNMALLAMRQIALQGGCSHFLVANIPSIDRVFYSDKGAASVFPLYLYPAECEMQFESGNRRPNLNPEFIKAASDRLGLSFIEDGKGNLEETFGPEDIFNYAYAIFHSPAYRTRYAEFLKIDFPRLPLTSNRGLFKLLVEKGAELVSLHLMESSALNNLITKYPVTGSNTMEKVAYDEAKERVCINKEQYFEGVPPEVWEFNVGGYQVCHKWLKDRKDRTLSFDDLVHYQKIIVALKETIQLMKEIDKLIPGWPIE